MFVKYFRHIIFAVLFVIAGSLAVFTVGCKSKCGSTTCQNGGDCESNVCVCPIGYSGNACQNSWSSIVIGTYNCSQSNCNRSIVNPASTWQSVITTDATNGGYTIDISNFDNSNTTVVAIIDSNIHGISQVTIDNSAGINATGSYDSTNQKINLIFTSYSGGISNYTCNMAMVKE